MMMGHEFIQMRNHMSQVVSYRDETLVQKDFKKKLFEVVKEDQMSKYYSEQVYPCSELIFLQS